MKTMKFIYRFILILSALALAASCVEKVSDADILAGRDRTTIEVSYALGGTEVKSVTVASASIKKTLEVTVNNENLKWNLESNRDWCVVVPEEHRGSGSVTLSIAANEDFEAREPATLTFVAGDFRGFQITVNQNATAFIIGQPYFVSGIDGGSYNVNVTTPAGTEWNIDAEDWMEVTEGAPSAGEDFTTTALTIKASANAGASRYGSVRLSAGEEKGYINVFQFGTELTYEGGSILLEGTEGASLTLTAPAYVVNSVQAPKFAAATVTENEDGTSTVNVVLKENLSDCSENREVELSLQLANASATIVELPSIVQDYIPANGLVTGKGMMTFAKAVAEGQPTTDWEDNGVVTVKGEIDMSEVEGWTGIGTADSPFKGKFNGGGFEITDLKNTSAGLFAYCEGATIQNVVLGKGCSLYYDKSYTGLGGAFGGIVSVAKETTTVTACQFDGAMDFAGTNDNDEPAYIGGIVGYADETSTVTKSKMTGKIVLTSPSTSTESYVGGIVGMSKGTITNNEMGGEVLAQTGNILTVGGIASALPAETKVGSNSFMGTLTMGSGNTSQMIFGGLYGKILADRSFDKTSDMSVTLGTININGYSGGTSTSLFVGGFIGRAEAGVTLSFNGYEAQTNIFYDQTAVRTTAYACFGGILGGCDVSSKVESVTFENVSNQGSFTTEYNSKNAVSLYRGFVGGIAGYINGVSSFVNCKNQGEMGQVASVWNARSNNYFMVFGGVAGVIVGGDAHFDKCQNDAGITNMFYSNRDVTFTSNGWHAPCVAAGILGAFEYMVDPGTGNLTMNECTNSAPIKSIRGNVAGILGFARRATLTSCNNTGNLDRLLTGTDHDAPYKAGIAAWLIDSNVKHCISVCKVYACGPSTTNQHAGGIISLAEGKVDVEGCAYYGDLITLPADGKKPVCGGVISEVGSESDVTIRECRLGGNVDGTPINGNNVASLAVGTGECTCTNITLWNGTL